MAISMQSGTQPPGLSNYERPVAAGGGSYQFYETIYTISGPQEWIIMPQLGPGTVDASVTVSFPTGAGAVSLEGTTSPACIIDGKFTPKGYAGPVTYMLAGHPIDPNTGFQMNLTDTTNFLIQGPTAIRINLLGGSCMISVRV
jgi:hypothetical protein